MVLYFIDFDGPFITIWLTL
uniref:Uncharacterized protein n=1 Tax=Arundo donax TaxID=35708 RepID=A0A0A9G452_ARUDO